MACGNDYTIAGGASTPQQSFDQATGEYYDQSYDASDCNNELLCWIKNHPIAAIGIALAVGLLLGRR